MLKGALWVLLLTFVIRECHEQAHAFCARLLYGFWIPRSLNHWESPDFATSYQEAIVYAAGPVFMLAVYFLLLMLWKKNIQPWSFIILLASNPLAVVYATIQGGGDVWHAIRLGQSVWFYLLLSYPLMAIVLTGLALFRPPNYFNEIKYKPFAVALIMLGVWAWEFLVH